MAGLSRRQVLRTFTGVGCGLIGTWLAACGNAPAAAPTAAPAKPNTAGAPAASGAAPAAATSAPGAPATTAAAAPQQQAGTAPITLRYMERAGALGEFMRVWSRKYEEAHPGVTVKNESASWTDLSTKVSTYVAAGTMADVAFQHGQLMLPELAAKGVWTNLEEIGNAEQHDWKQYYSWALDSLRLGPKNALVGMPMGIHSGQNQLLWNKSLFQKAGVKEPTPDMSLDDLTKMAVNLKQALPDVWPIMSGLTHWDLEAHSRSFKGYLVSEDRTKVGFNLPETQKAHRYFYDWINTSKVQPGRQAIQGSQAEMFYAQRLVIAVNCAPNIFVGFNAATNGAFQLGDMMWPAQPSGVVGTVPNADANVIYGKTQQKDHAWGLVKMLSSFEASKWTAVNEPHMTPGAVVKAWNDPEVQAACPPYKTLADFLNDMEKKGLKVGATPVPMNTRRAEYDDLYNNEWQAMVYGEKPYDDNAVNALQQKLQAIMDKPLP